MRPRPMKVRTRRFAAGCLRLGLDLGLLRRHVLNTPLSLLGSEVDERDPKDQQEQHPADGRGVALVEALECVLVEVDDRA